MFYVIKLTSDINCECDLYHLFFCGLCMMKEALQKKVKISICRMLEKYRKIKLKVVCARGEKWLSLWSKKRPSFAGLNLGGRVCVSC